MTDNLGIQTDVTPQESFIGATESGKWAIRMGAEPIDLHLSGDRGIKQEPGWFNMTAGPGGVFNHNYIEIGKINDAGGFETSKRIHGVGLEMKDDTLQMTE